MSQCLDHVTIFYVATNLGDYFVIEVIINFILRHMHYDWLCHSQQQLGFLFHTSVGSLKDHKRTKSLPLAGLKNFKPFLGDRTASEQIIITSEPQAGA